MVNPVNVQTSGIRQTEKDRRIQIMYVKTTNGKEAHEFKREEGGTCWRRKVGRRKGKREMI